MCSWAVAARMHHILLMFFINHNRGFSSTCLILVRTVSTHNQIRRLHEQLAGLLCQYCCIWTLEHYLHPHGPLIRTPATLPSTFL